MACPVNVAQSHLSQRIFHTKHFLMIAIRAQCSIDCRLDNIKLTQNEATQCAFELMIAEKVIHIVVESQHLALVMSYLEMSRTFHVYIVACWHLMIPLCFTVRLKSVSFLKSICWCLHPSIEQNVINDQPSIGCLLILVVTFRLHLGEPAKD
jgi:hypothetical protein